MEATVRILRCVCLEYSIMTWITPASSTLCGAELIALSSPRPRHNFRITHRTDVPPLAKANRCTYVKFIASVTSVISEGFLEL